MQIRDYESGGQYSAYRRSTERWHMRFQVEVRSRASAETYAAWFCVEADSEREALDEAMRTFRGGNPGKNIDDYTFKVVGI